MGVPETCTMSVVPSLTNHIVIYWLFKNPRFPVVELCRIRESPRRVRSCCASSVLSFLPYPASQGVVVMKFCRHTVLCIEFKESGLVPRKPEFLAPRVLRAPQSSRIVFTSFPIARVTRPVNAVLSVRAFPIISRLSRYLADFVVSPFVFFQEHATLLPS